MSESEIELLQAVRKELATHMPSELIQIPDGEPFAPGPAGISHTIGGPAPKAGDSAGYQTLHSAFAGGNWSSGIGPWRVQRMRWAHNPEFARVSALLTQIDAVILKEIAV